MFRKSIWGLYGEIGEVVNTVDCGSIMQGFDSLISPHICEIKPFGFKT